MLQFFSIQPVTAEVQLDAITACIFIIEYNQKNASRNAKSAVASSLAISLLCDVAFQRVPSSSAALERARDVVQEGAFLVPEPVSQYVEGF